LILRAVVGRTRKPQHRPETQVNRYGDSNIELKHKWIEGDYTPAISFTTAAYLVATHI